MLEVYNRKQIHVFIYSTYKEQGKGHSVIKRRLELANHIPHTAASYRLDSICSHKLSPTRRKNICSCKISVSNCNMSLLQVNIPVVKTVASYLYYILQVTKCITYYR